MQTSFFLILLQPYFLHKKRNYCRNKKQSRCHDKDEDDHDLIISIVIFDLICAIIEILSLLFSRKKSPNHNFIFLVEMIERVK